MPARATALAQRLEKGVTQLAALAESLSDAEWTKPIPGDGRSAGVLVHHVASMYPVELQLAQAMASGKAVTDVPWSAVHQMNADHSAKHANVTKAEAIALLKTNGAAAAAGIRAFTDAQLDTAVQMSLYGGNVEVSTQFFVEDHPVRHSYHHMGKIRDALGKR